MDQMDTTPLLLALLVPAALGLAVLAGIATALCLRLLPPPASAGRLLVASLASLGLLQAALWLVMPRWWRDTPAEHLGFVALVQAAVSLAFLVFSGGRRAALPPSEE